LKIFDLNEFKSRHRLEAKGIKVLVPKETDRVIVNLVIYKELCMRQIIDESRAKIIEDLIDQGAE